MMLLVEKSERVTGKSRVRGVVARTSTRRVVVPRGVIRSSKTNISRLVFKKKKIACCAAVSAAGQPTGRADKFTNWSEKNAKIVDKMYRYGCTVLPVVLVWDRGETNEAERRKKMLSGRRLAQPRFTTTMHSSTSSHHEESRNKKERSSSRPRGPLSARARPMPFKRSTKPIQTETCRSEERAWPKTVSLWDPCARRYFVLCIV